jgi:hypothetical protein
MARQRIARSALLAVMCAVSIGIGVISYSGNHEFWTTLDWSSANFSSPLLRGRCPEGAEGATIVVAVGKRTAAAMMTALLIFPSVCSPSHCWRGHAPSFGRERA